MIEGSEELKAYAYEASHLSRVDSYMEEGGSYHAVYMNNPKLQNWTKTHGGPYYVEVGKNIEIQYHTRVNVTVKGKLTESKTTETKPTEPKPTETKENKTAETSTQENKET